MTDRYTQDELARLTDADVVRRELDRINRRVLAVSLVIFAVFAFLSVVTAYRWLYGWLVALFYARFRLTRRQTIGVFAAAVVVLFDKDQRRATIASAGHPPVILRRGASTEIIEAFAPPLDVRLVYEARNADGEEYGLERLRQFLAAQPGKATADELRDAIVRDVERFRGGPQDDDVTVVVARVTIGAAWT